MMEWFGVFLYTLIGLFCFFYAFYSDRFHFQVNEHLPGILGERKVLFMFGLLIVLAGFGSAYILESHHALITLVGGWIMVLGSSTWFDRRIVRKSFALEERRVIRTTIFTGFFIVVLATGLFYFPPRFSPAGVLVGLSVMVLAGRLWWNQDPEFDYQTMVFSKRDYS